MGAWLIRPALSYSVLRTHYQMGSLKDTACGVLPCVLWHLPCPVCYVYRPRIPARRTLPRPPDRQVEVIASTSPLHHRRRRRLQVQPAVRVHAAGTANRSRKSITVNLNHSQSRRHGRFGGRRALRLAVRPAAVAILPGTGGRQSRQGDIWTLGRLAARGLQPPDAACHPRRVRCHSAAICLQQRWPVEHPQSVFTPKHAVLAAHIPGHTGTDVSHGWLAG